MRRVVVAIITLFALCVTSTAWADITATFTPSQDTSIWSNNQSSDGAGTTLWMGRNGPSASGHYERALIQFAITGIPSGSTIVSANIAVDVVGVPGTNGGGSAAAGWSYLYRITNSWVEGSATGSGTGGGASSGATWSYRNYLVTAWGAAGGDYNGSYSGYSYLDTATGSKTYTFSATGLNDISSFISGGLSNYGWLFIFGESTYKTARKFYSSEGSVPPVLSITYRYPQGHACSSSADCGTGYCTNSVCCNVASCTAAGECYNAGTCQAGSGVCSNPAKGSGSSCTADSNPCTVDHCDGAGTCVHTAGNAGTACPDDGNPCTLDQCNGSSTTCQHPAGNAGASCPDDGNPCTLDQCNGSSTTCQHPAGNNGAACDDANACTQTDTCSGGSCVGGNPVVCTALDECHDVGTCNTGTGVCSNPASSSAKACTADSNPCTADHCNGSGSCIHTAGNAGSQCSPPSCACPGGNCTATLASQCDGVSTSCPVASQVSCQGALCNGNVCAGGCTVDGDCSSGYFCLGGACTLKYDDGKTCVANNYCKNAHCVDSTCCATACAGGTGDCQACNVNGHEGTCYPIPGGTKCRSAVDVCDADDFCNGSSTVCTDTKQASSVPCRSSAGTCDVVENCDGVTDACPTDGFKSSATQCRAPSCTAGVETHAASCPGNGPTCPSLVTQSCGNYVCGATACKTSCSSDTDCSTGNWCNGGACVPKYGAGVGCTAANQCGSNFCVDSVCCDKACSGQCEACDVAGSAGTCKPVAGNPHGARTACAADGSSCSGACNGTLTTACSYPGASTSCRSASCAAGVATVGANCNGSGSCPALQTVTCDPFVCGATACLGNCAGDVDCIPGDYCAAGVCTPRIANGGTCGSDHECDGGHCTDGVCCDSACNGQCEACDIGGSVGKCTATTGAPHGTRPACVADGSTCDGTCDGQDHYACSYPGTGTVCRQASCTSGTATLIAFCSGTGVCPPMQQQDCAPGTCGTTTCNGDCQFDGDCSFNEFCSAGICKSKLDNGAACGTGSQCKSSLCVDGVCCNTACTGQCEACDVSGSAGTCVPVVGAPQGVRAPCATDGSACGGTCDGVQRQGCAYVGSATQCRSASCTSNVATLPASCAGTGSCPTAIAVSCTPNTCSGNKCGGGCTTNANCASNQFCGGGVCLAKFPAGAQCDIDAHCGSGHCVDGFCCDTACSGQCEACDVPPNVGTCTTLTKGQPHAGRPACPGTGVCMGTCNGSSATACALPDATTSCGSAACTGGVLVSAAACNGAGSCVTPSFTNCAPYACAGTTCLTACTSTSDCALGYECVGSACTPVVVTPDAGADADAGSPDAGGDADASSAGASGSGGAAGAAGASGTGGAGTGGTAGASGTGGTSGASGTGGTSGSSSGGASGSGTGGSGATDAGTDSGTKPGAGASDTGGCGCHVPGRGRGPGAPALLGLLGLAVVAARRRKYRRHARP